MRIAFFPGSFDPMTNGHVDVLEQALALCDKLVVGVGVHPGKVPIFSFDERAHMIAHVVADKFPHRKDDVRVVSFQNLLVDAVREAGATIIVRGLRDTTDFAYEMQMSEMNRTMAADITTVFAPAYAQSRHITATLVRQIARMGGDISPFVPDVVQTAFAARLMENK